MKTFNYHSAKEIKEASKLASSNSAFLAGGMTTIPSMKLGLATYKDIIDIKGIKKLSGIKASGKTVRIGATTKHVEVARSKEVKKAIPSLAALSEGIGDPQVRNRGTIGGSIANNDPAADYPSACLALNATIHTSKRKIPADKFFKGMFETDLKKGELIEAIEFEIPEKSRVLTVVGRIRPVKGHRILLQGFSELLSEFPDLVLLMPYRDTSENEPEMTALRTAINQLDLKDHVRLIPEREDILQIMEFADLGIVSSVDSEVICRVAMEFFSVATPVVAFPTGCLPEIIRHGQNGMLAKNKTSRAIVVEIRNVLSSPELSDRISQGARRDAEVRFAPQIMLDKTLEVFESALLSCR